MPPASSPEAVSLHSGDDVAIQSAASRVVAFYDDALRDATDTRQILTQHLGVALDQLAALPADAKAVLFAND